MALVSRSADTLTGISRLIFIEQTFKKRAAEIADHAHNPKGALGDGVEFLQGLDETERRCMSCI